jgi:hypothetical protein
LKLGRGRQALRISLCFSIHCFIPHMRFGESLRESREKVTSNSIKLALPGVVGNFLCCWQSPANGSILPLR